MTGYVASPPAGAAVCPICGARVSNRPVIEDNEERTWQTVHDEWHAALDALSTAVTEHLADTKAHK